jgi:hypothetical protein
VNVEFHVESGPRVLWRIGRDLLYQGLFSMSGLGDVQIWPMHLDERGTALLKLRARDTAALFELPVPELEEWLDHTYELVPPGRESADADWDAITTRLLQGPSMKSD